jgi:hypothetical protein
VGWYVISKTFPSWGRKHIALVFMVIVFPVLWLLEECIDVRLSGERHTKMLKKKGICCSQLNAARNDDELVSQTLQAASS